MNLGIEGKIALVVGASKGIGRAVAKGLAQEGCTVFAAARDVALLDSLIEECGSHVGSHVYKIPIDLMPDGAEKLAARVGTADIIYHCMGGSYGGIKEWDKPWSSWERVYRFNLGIAHDINRLLVPAMLERGWGRVVMTSTDGTASASGNPPYTSSKFALEGYVRTVAKQWVQRGVILSAVAPGNVYTPGLPMYEQSAEGQSEYWKHHVAAGRWAKHEEIAAAILPLCGEPASWMPGAIVRVDGGAR